MLIDGEDELNWEGTGGVYYWTGRVTEVGIDNAWRDWWDPAERDMERDLYAYLMMIMREWQLGMRVLTPGHVDCDDYVTAQFPWRHRPTATSTTAMGSHNPENPVWESVEESVFQLLLVDHKVVPGICRGGQVTLGTSGGVLLPKTNLANPDPPRV